MPALPVALPALPLFFHGWNPLPTAASANGGGLFDDNLLHCAASMASGVPRRPGCSYSKRKKKTWMNITIGSITNCLIVKSSANQSWARAGWYANEASQIIPERTTTGNWKYPHWYANEMQMRRIVLQSTFLFCFVFISPVNLNLPYANRMQMREIWPFIYLFIYLFILVPSGVYLFHFYDRLEIKFRRSLTNCWVN